MAQLVRDDPRAVAGAKRLRLAVSASSLNGGSRLYSSINYKIRINKEATPFVIKFLLLLLNLYSVYSSTPCTLPCTSFVLQCTLHRRVLYVL